VYNKEVPPEKDLVVEESALIIIVNMYITRTCQYYGFSKKSNRTMTFTYLKIKELQISKKISGSRFKVGSYDTYLWY